MGTRPKYTRHVPPHIREVLDHERLQYPAAWTLDQIAEESYRGHRVGRFQRPVHAIRFISHWGLYKLATCSLVLPQHWAYLDPPGAAVLDKLNFKLVQILMPATGADPTWRSSDRERVAALKKLEAAASTILNHRIHVTLGDVVERYGAMQPLLEASDKIAEQAMFAQHLASHRARATNEDPLLAMIEVMRTGYTEPTLAHFVATFRAKVQQMSAKDLSDGGGFGAYPRQKSALRRSVIRNLAWALLDDELERPVVALSEVIDVVSTAWFGNAPSRKHIEDLIRPIRLRAAESAALRAESLEFCKKVFGGNLLRTKAKISGGLGRSRK